VNTGDGANWSADPDSERCNAISPVNRNVIESGAMIGGFGTTASGWAVALGLLAGESKSLQHSGKARISTAELP
jgi:hypothetical protein